VGGYTLFVKEGKPTYEYNTFTILAPEKLGAADLEQMKRARARVRLAE